MKYYLGIDIGGTHIKGGIVNLLSDVPSIRKHRITML